MKICKGCKKQYVSKNKLKSFCTYRCYDRYRKKNQPDRLNPETSKEDVIVRTHREL